MKKKLKMKELVHLSKCHDLQPIGFVNLELILVFHYLVGPYYNYYYLQRGKKMMNNMMKNITPEQMKSMSAATGMKLSDEQAEAMAQQMKGMKEEDLERMMAIATKLNKAKQFVLKHKLIIIAVLVLLVGLFLRWLGWA